jgi:hypothetical protein
VEGKIVIQEERERMIDEKRERLIVLIGDVLEKAGEAVSLAESLVDRLVEIDGMMLGEMQEFAEV